MKNKYSLLLLFAAFCCMGVQCKEEEPDKIEELAKLPPATTKGRNTFGCLINAKAWPIGAVGRHTQYVSYDKGVFFINYSVDFNSVTPNSSLSIKASDIFKGGIYTIFFDVTSKAFVYSYYDGVSFSSGDNINKNSNATLQITRLDSISKIVSGKFTFSLKNADGTKQVNIDHGRFDYQYQ